MPRCRCSGGCTCLVEAVDSESVDLTVGGTGGAGSPFTFQADAILLPDATAPLAGDNPLKLAAGGLYVELPPDPPVPEVIMVAASDETTVITTGVAKVTFRMPYAMTLTEVRGSLTVTSSSGVPQFDINEAGVSILSTKITINVGETTSVTAATPPVISDSSLADNAEITIDFDAAGTGVKGVKIYLIGTRT